MCYVYDTIEQTGIEKGKLLGIEEGKQLGIEEGIKQTICSLYLSGDLSLAQSCQKLMLTTKQFLALIPAYQQTGDPK